MRPRGMRTDRHFVSSGVHGADKRASTSSSSSESRALVLRMLMSQSSDLKLGSRRCEHGSGLQLLDGRYAVCSRQITARRYPSMASSSARRSTPGSLIALISDAKWSRRECVGKTASSEPNGPTARGDCSRADQETKHPSTVDASVAISSICLDDRFGASRVRNSVRGLGYRSVELEVVVDFAVETIQTAVLFSHRLLAAARSLCQPSMPTQPGV